MLAVPIVSRVSSCHQATAVGRIPWLVVPGSVSCLGADVFRSVSGDDCCVSLAPGAPSDSEEKASAALNGLWDVVGMRDNDV